MELSKIGRVFHFNNKVRGYFFWDKFKNDEWILASGVFLLFLFLNSVIYLTVSNVSSSDDQWFYTKVAYLIKTNGWEGIVNFRGAYFTDLSQSGYSYAVGLYHYFLIPFTFFSDKTLGLKLSGLFLASLTPTIIWLVLRRLRIRWAFLWVVVFFYVLASFNFTFRLFLNRPFVLIDALIVLEIYLIGKKKYWQLFFLSLVHTWWHPASFWLPALLVGCFELVLLIHNKKIDLKLVILAIFGSLGGFLFFPPHSHTFLSPANPFYFIKTLFSFIYGLGNGPQIIEGSENYKGDIFEMLYQSNLIFILLLFYIILNITLYIYRRNNNDGMNDLDLYEQRVFLREHIFLVVIIIFLGFVFSKRFEDLLIPLVLLGSAISFQMLWEGGYLKIDNLIVRKVFVYLLVIFIIVSGGNRVLDTRKSIGSDENFRKYEKVGNWLMANTQKNEIVFNTDFGQFNRLFFYDSWNRYIVGIEPKNMYEYSQEKYWLWHNITLYGIAYKEGDYGRENFEKMTKDKSEEEIGNIMLKNSREIAFIVKNEFQSEYIFFDGDRFLKKEIEKNFDDYELAYEDKEAGVFVYRIK